MAEQPRDHLFVEGFVRAHDFRSPLSVRREPAPQRDRIPHGERLLNQLRDLQHERDAVASRRAEMRLPEHLGMTVAVEMRPKNTIDYKQLEWKRDGIEVLTVIEGEQSDVVAIHVPDGKLAAFEKRVRDYLEKNAPRSDKPANASLINAIECFRRAAFRELWTDDEEPPADDDRRWYQVWLRRTSEDPQQVIRRFGELGAALNLNVENGFVAFPGRVVVAAHTSRRALEDTLTLLDMVAEIRGVAPTAEFFLAQLKPFEQAEWIEDLVRRTTFANAENCPYVTLLDTGVNQAHPLLAPGLAPHDMHAVDPAWGTADHNGHGTEMAGLGLHGNLVQPLAADTLYSIPHRLESVKIWPPAGANARHLYGDITSNAVARVEVGHAERQRTFALLTTCDGRITGAPSEWSAAIDQLAFGRAPVDISSTIEEEDEVSQQRLFVLAAGNVPWPNWTDYPNVNAVTTVESPGQAWNALTVGGCTQLTSLDVAKYPGYRTIAALGDLCPASTTSLLWTKNWPLKPDVVAEGANGSLDPHHVVVGPDSLRLLTTSRDIVVSPLAESGDTSAAAMEVARVCAHISSRYPDYWPETVRGLIVHGARYTNAMRGTLPVAPRKLHKENLLRTFGYGQVDENNSVYSYLRRPTLVIQQTFVPYRLDGGAVKLGQMLLHDLPWPTEELTRFGEAEVAFRVTLSYFVEPNPSRRGWQSKFRYQSFALRFAVKAATEDAEQFIRRVNMLERDTDSDETYNDPDVANWTLGPQLRSRGSLHSDLWTGTAAELANKSQVAVFPVGGWWKDWKEAARYESEARYALILSLEVSEVVDTDIYTPILTRLAVPVPVELSL